MRKVFGFWMLCVFGFVPNIFCQYDQLDTLGFISPVLHPIKLSGNFGELRANHFHSGLDIKSSKGQTGDPIICIQDGWVSRVKIQLSGYGHALYIDHPNGYTSVYAHLDRYSDKLEKFINRKQNLLQSYRLDLYLDQDQLKFSKGDTIGYMGNTGRSTGPHLHFEIRETISEEPMNPFHFGIKVSDSIRPKINGIRVYGLDKNLVPINQKYISADKKSVLKYTIDAWRAGIGLNAHDILDGTWNKNGIYKFELFVNDSLQFTSSFDQFSFYQTRYINACIDYETKKKSGSRYLLSYKQPGNNLAMYANNNGNGVIQLFKDKPSLVKLVVYDFEGNSDVSEFSLSRKSEVSPLVKPSSQYYLEYKKPHTIVSDKLTVDLPAESFYSDIFFDVSYIESEDNSAFVIGQKTIPCHKYFTIKVDVSNYPDSIRNSLCVLYLDEGSIKTIGGKLENDTLIAKINRFGRFRIGVDSNPPIITITSKLNHLQPGHKVRFKMYDKLNTIGFAHDVSWDVFLDGEWILSPYDLKSKKAHFLIPDDIAPGNHNLQIIARDDRGNTQRIEKNILVEPALAN